MASVLTLLSGNASKDLAEDVAKILDGATLAPATVSKFANGETSVSIGVSVREADVFVIQSGMGNIGTNDAVMELLILCNAARIASAQRVVLVVPYFPYAKQNKVKKRGAVPARLMADMMKMAGAHHIITVDLNPAQMLGFFHTPCDNMMIWPLFQQYVLHRKRDWGDCIVVAKNPGASKRAARLAKMLDLDIALVLDRGEEDDDSGAPPETMAPTPTSNPTTPCDSPARPSSVMSSPGSPIEVPYRPGNIIGKVMGRTCILVDDVLDGGNSFCSPANTLMMAGARQVVVMVTHGVMSGNCPKVMQDSVITEVVVTNSIPQERHQAECEKLRVIRIEGVLAEAIRRVHNDECMSSKFINDLELA